MDNKFVKKVLFVCTGNTCRSPMCEGVFNKLALNAATSFSAGVSVVEDKIAYNSYMVLLEKGIDLSYKVPTPITTQMIDDCDVVLTMTKEHKLYLPKNEKVFSLAEFVSLGDVSDPFGQDIEVYRATLAQIEKICQKVLDKVLKM